MVATFGVPSGQKCFGSSHFVSFGVMDPRSQKYPGKQTPLQSALCKLEIEPYLPFGHCLQPLILPHSPAGQSNGDL